MSTSTTTAAAATHSPSPPTLTQALSFLGIGYTIAITLIFLILLSTILLTTYICFRRLHHPPSPPQLPTTTTTTITILPRIIFVAESSSSSSSSTSSPTHNTHSSAIGLAQAVINSYPKLQFAKSKADSTTTTTTTAICSICLSEYKECEMLRVMPDCNHFFHLLCLDAWLKLNGSCPVCRNSPLPTPVSTPLAEVVPLTMYGDNRRTRR